MKYHIIITFDKIIAGIFFINFEVIKNIVLYGLFDSSVWLQKNGAATFDPKKALLFYYLPSTVIWIIILVALSINKIHIAFISFFVCTFTIGCACLLALLGLAFGFWVLSLFGEANSSSSSNAGSKTLEEKEPQLFKDLANSILTSKYEVTSSEEMELDRDLDTAEKDPSMASFFINKWASFEGQKTHDWYLNH